MIGLWLVLSGAALFGMADYGNKPGEAGTAPDIWPSALSVGIVPTPGKATVVLFAHPLCPCTRATLVELESLTNRLYGLFDLHVLFYEPTDVAAMPEVWAASDLKRIAVKLPGTQLHSDKEDDRKLQSVPVSGLLQQSESPLVTDNPASGKPLNDVG